MSQTREQAVSWNLRATKPQKEAELAQAKAELAWAREAELAWARAKEEGSKVRRELAFKYHPDRNPGNPASGEVMSDINRLYQAFLGK